MVYFISVFHSAHFFPIKNDAIFLRFQKTFKHNFFKVILNMKYTHPCQYSNIEIDQDKYQNRRL